MLHSKFKIILLSTTSLFLLTILTSGILLLRYLPDNKYSITLFKTVYELPLGKKSFLEFYSPVRESNRGYIPTDINNFLIQHLENSTDENEISAIVNFYAIQASGHRLGYLNYVSEECKIKVINQLIKEIDDEATLRGKLMIIEEFRNVSSLGKGSVEIEGVYHQFSTYEEYIKWFYEQASPIVIPKYRNWWNSNLNCEEKRKINPLESTNIKVTECCG